MKIFDFGKYNDKRTQSKLTGFSASSTDLLRILRRTVCRSTDGMSRLILGRLTDYESTDGISRLIVSRLTVYESTDWIYRLIDGRLTVDLDMTG